MEEEGEKMMQTHSTPEQEMRSRNVILPQRESSDVNRSTRGSSLVEVVSVLFLLFLVSSWPPFDDKEQDQEENNYYNSIHEQLAIQNLDLE